MFVVTAFVAKFRLGAAFAKYLEYEVAETPLDLRMHQHHREDDYGVNKIESVGDSDKHDKAGIRTIRQAVYGRNEITHTKQQVIDRDGYDVAVVVVDEHLPHSLLDGDLWHVALKVYRRNHQHHEIDEYEASLYEH